MRFELKLMNDGTVAIFDTYEDRNPVFVPNNDRCIRNGIKLFYDMDAFRYNLDNDEQEGYVSKMMEQLPKEDLSFKEVKEID